MGQLGRFSLKQLLGQGAFGRVFQAYDPQLDRVVALKVPKLSGDDRARIQRFLTEAKAAASLRHPNIIPIFECGRADDSLYISSQFIRGTTLAERIRSERPEFRQAAQWTAAIARALAYAHSQGIVHRDVKPQNIMVDEHDEPQIMDFGLAKRVDEDSSLTTDGSILGTPAYMAPEQARGETAAIGPLSDQYSVGVILYEFLSGRKPFEGPPHVVIASVARSDPPALRTLRQDVPRDLAAICHKAMQKEPRERYPSAEAMAEDLGRWLNGEPTSARPMSSLELCLNWRRRNPAVANLIMAVTLTIAVGLLAVSIALAMVAAQKREAVLARRAAEEAQGAATANAEQARRERDRAEVNLEEANRQRTLADQQRQLAEDRLRKIEEEKQRGDQLQADSDKKQRQILSEVQQRQMAEQRSRFGQYLNLIDRASRAANEHPQSAEELLGECEAEFRLWEWQFLKSCCLRETRKMSLTGQPLSTIALSPRGDRFAACDSSGSVGVFGTTDPSLDGKPGALAAKGTWVSFIATGSQFLAGGKTPGMALWDLASSTVVPPGFPLRDTITCCSLAPDGKMAATASGSRDPFNQQDHLVRIWDVTTGQVIRNLTGHTQPVCELQFSADGQTLASGDLGGEIRLWRTISGEGVTSGSYRGAIRRIAFNPDGSRFAVLTDALEGLTVSSSRSGRATDTAAMKGTKLLDVAFSEDGSAIAAIDRQGQGYLWDRTVKPTNRSLYAEPLPFTKAQPASHGLLTNRNGSWLICLADASSAYFERTQRGVRGQVLRGHAGAVQSIAASLDGAMLASGGNDGSVWLWNPRSGQRRRIDGRLAGPARALTLLSDQQVIAVGKVNGSIGLISGQTGTSIRELPGFAVPVRAVAKSGDDTYLCAGGEDGTIRLWRTSDWKLANEFKVPGVAVLATDLSVKGDKLAAAFSDGTVRLWGNTDDMTSPSTLSGHVGPVNAVRISPSGDLVASAGEDAVVKVWNWSDREPLVTIRGHFAGVRALTFSPNGDRLASVGADCTLRTWDPMTGLETFRLVAGDAPLTTLTFFAGGQALAVGGEDGAIQVFDAGPAPQSSPSPSAAPFKAGDPPSPTPAPQEQPKP